MIQSQSSPKKGVLFAAAGAVGLMLLGIVWFNSQGNAGVPATAEKPPVAAAVTPPPAPPPPAPAPEADQSAEIKAALLGLDKKPEVAQIEEPKPKSEPIAKLHARKAAPADDSEQDRALISSFSGSSGLSDIDFHDTIEHWRGMKSCLHSHKKRDTESSGALRVALKITSGGEVVESRVYDESNELAKLLAKCVEKQALQIRFPPFRGGDAVVKEAKFVF